MSVCSSAAVLVSVFRFFCQPWSVVGQGVWASSEEDEARGQCSPHFAAQRARTVAETAAIMASLILGFGVGAAASAGRKQPVHAQCTLSGGLAGSSCSKVPRFDVFVSSCDVQGSSA